MKAVVAFEYKLRRIIYMILDEKVPYDEKRGKRVITGYL